MTVKCFGALKLCECNPIPMLNLFNMLKYVKLMLNTFLNLKTLSVCVYPL